MTEQTQDPEGMLPLTPAVFNILLALADGEKHGYGIMLEVDANTNGQVKMGPGTLYGSIKRMLAAGLYVTLNTDDPSISRITLSHEYYVACEDLQMPQNILKERIVAAAQAGFLPDAEKEKVVNQLKQDLKV